MDIDLTDPLIQGILITVLGGLLLAFVALIFKKVQVSGTGFLLGLRRGVRKKTGLEIYRHHLEEEILKISHPWMKEDQTLNDILVPVNFEFKKQTERTELETYLRHVFKKHTSPRILIVGKPGSGKSVAMRVIAKAVWTFAPDILLVPVPLTFSEIKGVKNGKELERKIVDKLEYFQFEKGQRDNTTAEAFVKENLYDGKILLLFDGYDELDKAARESISALLRGFLGTHRQIPAVISSRVAVYERELAFDALTPHKVTMAPFTPFAILKFLSQWRFEGKKSSHELFQIINGRAHLSEIASNPLMLTIISFLYSLPKYTLPDNRVEFYEQCTRALLEEWDRTKETGRANRFESHQKIAVLNRVAFDHISHATETDEFIAQDKIHAITREEMGRMGLKAEDYALMKNELVLNSGLLQFIPPTDFRFPHRTFMEFFAANYIGTQHSYETILDLYQQDAERWKQTLLLYMGLNKKKDSSNAILHHLRDDFTATWQNGALPKTLVFDALTESAVTDPDLANEILDLAEQYLNEHALSPEIIEQLGFIGGNPRWAHAQKAKDILLHLLDRDLPEETFQQVLFALLHARDERIDDVILNNIRRLNLASFFSDLGSRDRAFIHKLLDLNLPPDEKRKLIEGLKEAGNFAILNSLLIESRDDDIRALAAYALFWMSKLDGFFEALDEAEFGLLDKETEELINQEYAEWSWPWDDSKTETGKKMTTAICYFAAGWIAKHRDMVEETLLEVVNNRFRYLTTGFLVEKNITVQQVDLMRFENEGLFVTKAGLIKHWRNRIKLNSWYRNLHGFLEVLLGLFALFAPTLITALSVIGLICYLFDWRANGFYTLLFDGFTIAYLIFQYIGFILLAFIPLIIKGEKAPSDYKLVVALAPSMVTDYLPKLAPRSVYIISLLFASLAVIHVFLPFHTMLFNITLSISFLELGISTLDSGQIRFAIFHGGLTKHIYNLLDNPLEYNSKLEYYT